AVEQQDTARIAAEQARGLGQHQVEDFVDGARRIDDCQQVAHTLVDAASAFILTYTVLGFPVQSSILDSQRCLLRESPRQFDLFRGEGAWLRIVERDRPKDTAVRSQRSRDDSSQ